MLTDKKSFHFQADFKDASFVEELFEEIKGLRKPPTIVQKLYQPFSLTLRPPKKEDQTCLDVIEDAIPTESTMQVPFKVVYEAPKYGRKNEPI